jgi:hypothetical protein
LAAACGERKMFSAVSVSFNEVGVIVNSTVSEVPKVSSSIKLAALPSSGWADNCDLKAQHTTMFSLNRP